jgi:hypothetical protein
MECKMADYSSNSIGFLAKLNVPAPVGMADSEVCNDAPPPGYVDSVVAYAAYLEKKVLELSAALEDKKFYMN